ncbi:hypothetical protein QWJ26_26395 [Streptomyces sp. CSDS2]|uniref:hypothetical protein n=1 Tax=Streptomyces sp. CSDS2 TaxID=3055051 RepID=UPI0025AF5D34|nr:hypothetical protein [Streptomyces sp. CSDS2]MDN3263275.1 hypothetical protein [Streptomyces sp. CSDS2]
MSWWRWPSPSASTSGRSPSKARRPPASAAGTADGQVLGDGQQLGGAAVDDDMAAYARSLRANGVPVPEIARKLVITSGKNQGKRPSVATVYRILAEDDVTDPTA